MLPSSLCLAWPFQQNQFRPLYRYILAPLYILVPWPVKISFVKMVLYYLYFFSNLCIFLFDCVVMSLLLKLIICYLLNVIYRMLNSDLIQTGLQLLLLAWGNCIFHVRLSQIYSIFLILECDTCSFWYYNETCLHYLILQWNIHIFV